MVNRVNGVNRVNVQLQTKSNCAKVCLPIYLWLI